MIAYRTISAKEQVSHVLLLKSLLSAESSRSFGNVWYFARQQGVINILLRVCFYEIAPYLHISI